jgi:hypothetical protein
MGNLFDNSNAPKEAPTSFIRGDYVAWRNSSFVSTYDPVLHTLTYNFRREGEPSREFTVAGTTDAGEYLFEILQAVTATIEAGVYFWDLYIVEDSSSKRITVATGKTTVLANKADDSDDPRAFPRKMLHEIRRALLGRATSNQLDTLAGSLGVETSWTRNPEILRRLENQYKAEEVRANRKWRARRGLKHSGKIRVRI